MKLGNAVNNSREDVQSLEFVKALYSQPLNLDDDGSFALKARDFMDSYGECSQETYNSLTAHAYLHSFDRFKSLWGGSDVNIDDKARCKGVGVFGAPGGGKSVCLENTCLHDIRSLTALVLVDPTGELARRVYSHAKMWKRKVTYLSKENPVAGLNIMLAPYSKEQVAELVIAFINHITETTTSDLSATTRMRNAVYKDVLWCLENGRPRLDALADRLRLRHDPKNQHAIDGIVARLDAICAVPAVREILCNERAPINFLSSAEKKDVLILDTFGFGLGLPSVAIGSALSFLLKESFLAVRRETFHPLSFVVDEAHLFLDINYFTLLKMARKFRLMTTIATQDFSSINQVFKQVMISNLGTFVALNPGRREARDLCGEFQKLTDRDIKFLPKYHAAIKTPDFEGIVEMLPPPFVDVLPLPVRTVEKRRMWFVTS